MKVVRTEVKTCLTSSVASLPGLMPDLESSPEVLIWTWMFSGVVMEELEARISARPLSSWVAFLAESTEETRKRLGIWEARGLHLSVGREVLVLLLTKALSPEEQVNGECYGVLDEADLHLSGKV